MLEWLKRHAWKACIRQKRIASSNLAHSAKRNADYQMQDSPENQRFLFLSPDHTALALSLHRRQGGANTIYFFRHMAKPEYIQKNKAWLEEKSREEGVYPLDKGVFYKIIKRGKTDGPTPNRGSVVVAHYVGKTINGKTFDSSRGGVAPAFRLRELIPGWIIALQKMHIGDKWEIYIPAEQGYGKFNQPGIPSGSTLIFEIELLGIS